MLNKFLKLLIIATLLTSANAFAGLSEDEHIIPASDNRPVPWPWSLAQPFPWTDIQGLWKVEQGDFTSYFALKLVRQKSTGARQLQVKQFDGDTCRVLATGVAIERSQKVLAQMTSRAGMTYRVQLTAFKEKDSPIPPLKSNFPVQGVMVLSMGRLDSQEEMVHVQIKKISAHLTQKFCIEDVRK